MTLYTQNWHKFTRNKGNYQEIKQFPAMLRNVNPVAQLNQLNQLNPHFLDFYTKLTKLPETLDQMIDTNRTIKIG